MIGIFLDIETSGLDPFKHRSLEIALQMLDLRSRQPLASFEAMIYQPPAVWDSGDRASLAVNGLTWQQVSQGKEERAVSKEIISLFNAHEVRRGSALFICQNPSFDRAFFSQIVPVEEQERYQWPYHWLDLASMYWVLHARELDGENTSSKDGLSKDEIARSYHLPLEEKPHRAMNGVRHLVLCYETILKEMSTAQLGL